MLDPCARAEMIARRFVDIEADRDLVTDLFRAADALAAEGRAEFRDDLAGVALAHMWITGERLTI